MIKVMLGVLIIFAAGWLARGLWVVFGLRCRHCRKIIYSMPCVHCGKTHDERVAIPNQIFDCSHFECKNCSLFIKAYPCPYCGQKSIV